MTRLQGFGLACFTAGTSIVFMFDTACHRQYGFALMFLVLTLLNGAVAIYGHKKISRE